MKTQAISGFQLAPQQKRLWHLHKKNGSAFCSQSSILIEGNLQPEILRIATEQVVNHHDILKTNFYRPPGVKTPVMVVEDRNSFNWEYLDLSAFSEKNISNKVQELFWQARQEYQNLSQESLLYLYLIKLSESQHILIISLPTLCADTRTIKNLVNQISQAYAQCSKGKAFSKEYVQYVQFSEWQNQLLDDEDASSAEEYWQQQKISSLSTLKLPLEKLRNNQEFVTDSYKLVIGQELLNKINNFAQKYDQTPDVILLACWKILVWRLTGESEIVIGTASERRDYEELYDVLGLLATWLPIKTKFTPNLNFLELLTVVAQTLENAAEWQDYFVSEITEEDEIIAFSVGFECDKLPEKYSNTGISFAIDKLVNCIEPFKIKLSLIWSVSSLIAEFYYDVNYFSSETIQSLATQFETLLNNALVEPQKLISQLEILTQSDRQQLVFGFNQTRIDYTSTKCIHQLFAEQAAKTPNRIAVVYENEKITYAELNCKANQLANYLQTLGVKPRVVVGLCVERSLEMIIGLLAILKAGGAYLPLDPMLPQESLCFRLQNVQAPILLTQHQLANAFSIDVAQAVCIDTDWDTIAQSSDTNPICTTKIEDLVYVLFTSGSTGKPKGVAVEHRQLLNYLNGILDKLKPVDSANFATISTIAADLGNTVIFPALCTGGCLHVISHERATNPEALLDYCDHHPIDYLKIVPSHLNALLTASKPEKILPKRCLILGGEALSWNLVETLQKYAPNCRILNHYGPTETTVGVLTYSLNGEAIKDRSEIVPLGRPLSNIQIYILDHYLQPVPIGVTGELHIGGNSLARGYFNQVELTKRKFVDNPFNDEVGSRLYKTGDLARYLPDGNIEFLGRIDHQVKIRGFRIELGEVESVLQQHPTIRETVVLAQEDDSGNKRLIAYIVPHQHTFTATDIRDFLKQKLPDYMIPLAFVQLKSLPLTPNGKVDRQALPDPEQVRPELAQTFVQPRTPAEETIAKIWAQVLRIERVGINDNLFELGGDSIMTIQIAARVNQVGLQVTPKQIFEYPTVASLAAVIDTNLNIQSETGLLPLTPMQRRFFEEHLSKPQHCNQTLVLEVQKIIVPDLFEEAVQYLLQHHEALRFQFNSQQSAWQQSNTVTDAVKTASFSYIDLSGQLAEQQETALESILSELQTSLNLAEGLLLRAALLNFGNNQPQRLVLVIHYLVADSISWRILLKDLQQIYQKLSQKQPVKLPLKTNSFKQWTELLEQSNNLLQESDYWVKIFFHQYPSKLPVDNHNGVKTAASVGQVVDSLTIEETKALSQEIPKAYRTKVNEILVTALVQTYSQWTKSNSIMLDVEGEGREIFESKVDLSSTVGCFTSIFPVILSLESITESSEALKAIKEQMRRIPTQGISYGLLKYTKQEKQLQTLPQAEVKFKYVDSFDAVSSESHLFKTLRVESNSQINHPYLQEINTFVLGEKLQIEWKYNGQFYQKITIEQLVQRFIDTLRLLIAHCQSNAAGGFTSSDFPKAHLSQKDLDTFLAKINHKKNQ
ncbi:amino acid adenylation domain-containing protein [Calothrix sp. CCY 0018]|uniref:amino acid adenylation domain-containing protein n=1 Tax=Calothrix sp. CCY 0018 TaxID=3103864 RepID=UPI0039C6C36F